MEENSGIPFPVIFNCWKHHAGFINGQIKLIGSENEIACLKSMLLKIGESQMDLYFGKLSPKEISELIINSLKSKKVFFLHKYQKWLLDEGNDYRLVTLKDKSIWTLRFTENTERYIHIHPGRYSPFTVRVKATTVKTAILVLAVIKTGEPNSINTEQINKIRQKYLNEPPIKSYSGSPGLKRIIDLLKED